LGSRRAKRRVWILALVLVTGNACASARTRSFVELPEHVKAGDEVRLTDVTGSTVTGRVEGLSSESVTVLASAGRREVPATQVAKLDRRGRNVGRGTLIGLAAGIGLGIVAFNSVEPSNPYDLMAPAAAAGNALFSVVLGTGLGAASGALIKSFRTVYVAPVSPGQGVLNPAAAGANGARSWQWRQGTGLHPSAVVSQLAKGSGHEGAPLGKNEDGPAVTYRLERWHRR
jgi:hypothetical protein